MMVSTEFRSSESVVRGSKRSVARADLQGMRAVAVLAVFADHLFGWPRGGFVGVDIFFVLSGFFITGLLIRERSTTSRISFQNFYIRRARRILPSAMLVLTATVIASYILLPAVRARSTLIDALWASVFASNWRFERVGTDYFQEGQPPSPLQHYWSLSIEEQFYFVWPIVLVGLFALTKRFSQQRGYSGARQVTLAVAMAMICIASFAWSVIQTSTEPTGAYFSTLTRTWELGVGALLAICAPMLSRMPDKVRPALSYLGLAGIVAALFLISTESRFPGPWAALPVLSTALVVAAFQGREVRGVPHLTNPAMRYVGDVSYTLYLWHWPVIVLLAAVMTVGPIYYGTAILLVMALTALTYSCYENPIRKSRWLERPAGRSSTRSQRVSPTAWAAVGFVLAVLISVSALTLEHDDNRAQSSQANQELAVTSPLQLAEVRECFGADAMTTEGCPLRDTSNPLTPSIDTFVNDTQGAYKCFRNEGEVLQSCTYGYEGADGKRLAVIGDSHAAMLLPALSPQLIENKWSMTTYVGYGCQWQSPPRGDCKFDVMPRMQEQIMSGGYDAVITTSSRKYGGDTDEAVAAYLEAWRPVAATGTKIVVVSDNPGVSTEALACLTRVSFGEDNSGNCGSARGEALADEDPLPIAAASLAGVSLIDLTASFCTEELCPMVIGDVIVYRDMAGHITATFGRTLAPQLVSGIELALA